jgi:phosphoglycolate phosphatase
MKKATSKAKLHARSKLLVFDFDGVLAESNEQMLEAIQAASKKMKLKLPPIEELRKTHAREMLKKMGVGPFKAWRMVSFCQNYLTHLPSPPLKAGMKELLEEAKGTFTLGIVSTSTDKRIKDFIHAHGLASSFDFVHASVPLWGKDTILWKLSCERPSLKLLYVGDEERDIISGQKAGFQVISVSWGAKNGDFLQSCRPDYYVNTVELFRELLKAFD